MYINVHKVKGIEKVPIVKEIKLWFTAISQQFSPPNNSIINKKNQLTSDFVLRNFGSLKTNSLVKIVFHMFQEITHYNQRKTEHVNLCTILKHLCITRKL